VGRQLLEWLESSARTAGTFSVHLELRATNDGARRFYERMGWHHKAKIMEQVAGEHGQTDVPFWCMTKVLTI